MFAVVYRLIGLESIIIPVSPLVLHHHEITPAHTQTNQNRLTIIIMPIHIIIQSTSFLKDFFICCFIMNYFIDNDGSLMYLFN